MRYEWDGAKNRANFLKHGLRFEDAEKVFSGSCVQFVDDRFDYGEERLIALGYLDGRFVVIVHAPFEDGTRIISMRKGARHEENFYFKQFGSD